MLDRRAKILLKTLVEHYIAEGQPVGSRALSRYSGLDLSPATIRNIMSDLEELGFISSPHTSAGRIPTPRGYRIFVDTLLTIKPLEQVELSQIEGNLHPDDPRRLISSASQLLSQLSHFAGVVASPLRNSAAFRHLEFLALSEKRILLIIVTPDGNVQNRILFTEKSYTPAQLAMAANFLNQNYAGLTFGDIRARMQQELKQLHQDMSALMTAALEAGDRTRSKPPELRHLGRKKPVDSTGAASTWLCAGYRYSRKKPCSCRSSTWPRARRADFHRRRSGASLPDWCTWSPRSYTVDGQVVGTVGVIGPTRMAYERVIPIVDITARLLPALSGLSQPRPCHITPPGTELRRNQAALRPVPRA
jgi:heat-inducible transcriptional repressor